MASITVNYTIPFAASVKIGYRITGTIPFTYVTPYPDYTQSPYTITGLAIGSYDVELTTICANCSGGNPGVPIVFPAIST